MNPSVQAFALLLTLAFLTVIVRMVRGRKLRAKYSFLWLVTACITTIFALVPSFVEWLSSSIGIYYSPAMLFLGAIMLLLFIAVHFSWELSRLEDRTRTLAEELALARAEIESGRSGPRPDRTSTTNQA